MNKSYISVPDNSTRLNLNESLSVAFSSFEDGVRFSEQPHYKIYSLAEDYFFVKEDPKTVATTVALIFNEIIKNNG